MSDISAPGSNERRRLLFVCSGNTCRSVLAEYIANKKIGRTIDATSAGLRPGSARDAENAIATLKNRLNVDATSHQPRDVRTVDVDAFDLVIAMDSSVAREMRALFPSLSAERFVKWGIDDPYGDDLAEYDRCAGAVYAVLKRLPILASKL